MLWEISGAIAPYFNPFPSNKISCFMKKITVAATYAFHAFSFCDLVSFWPQK